MSDVLPVPASVEPELARYLDEQARRFQAQIDSIYAWQAYAREVFSFGAYGGAGAPIDSPFPDLGLAYQKIDVFTQPGVTPRGIIINLTNSSFRFVHEGVYNMSIAGAIEHNETNASREFYIRLYNETVAAPVGSGLLIGTGRNSTPTNIGVGDIFDIGAGALGQDFSLQIGGGSTYTNVVIQSMSYSFSAVSEWRGTGL